YEIPTQKQIVWNPGEHPTLGEFCLTMIGRAYIEGSKSDVARNAWPPQASYPCGNFPDTSCLKPKSYGSGLPTSVTYLVPTCQRLFLLETCCRYRYRRLARDLHPVPRMFKGQRELTGLCRNRDAFQGTEFSPGLPPASAGSVALPHWTPRGDHLHHSGFGDLNPTPFGSAESNGGHRLSLRNSARPSLGTD
uniref:Uncharacterized protein n=1 Tax=Cavia porcellus TaxID=10141 RepID=A0A286XL10_CAVPO